MARFKPRPPRCYEDEMKAYEEERQMLLERIRADTATEAERIRHRALGWKIEAVRQRMDSRYKSGVSESIRIMK